MAVGRERICWIEGLGDSVLVEKVQKALKMKGSQAAGMDRCYSECMKRDGVCIVKWLVRMLNVCCVTSMVLKDWVSDCTVPLYKEKGDKQECSNYRGISLPSPVEKVYGKVLINRIRST